MKKHKKTIVILVVILTVGLLYWYVIRPKLKAKKEAKQLEENTTNSSTPSYLPGGNSHGGSSSGYGCNLSKSSVKMVQQACNRVLKKQNKTLLSVDSIYGPKTDKAVKSITGKSCASYSEVKKAVIKWFESNGHENPYKSNHSGVSNEDNEDKSVSWWVNYLIGGGIDGNVLTPY